MAVQSLRYPLSRIEETSDYLRVNVVEFSPPGVEGGGGRDFVIRNNGGSNCARKKNLGTILLPMPDGIQDSNSVDWQASQANSIALSAAGNILQGLDASTLDGITSFEDGFSKISKMLTSTGNNALETIKEPEVREALAKYFTSQAVNVFGANLSADELLSRTNGTVLNPNKQFLFRGVNLREFNFTFTFNPRSAAESQQVKAIINTFKRRSAAKSSAGGRTRGLFIKAPDVFELEFRRGRSKHPFLYTMKTCALSKMSVDYMRTGNYITYEDSTPVQMAMSLSFNELNAVYAEDYDQVTDGVGF